MDSSGFNLTPIARAIWEDRYALKDDSGKITEASIIDTFRRVSRAIASKEKDPKKWENHFFDLLSKKYFCPAGRILANAGTPSSQLLNCYVVPFKDDSLESIMETARNMAVTQKHGGGTGFSYSKLRPEGAHIKGVNGRSCGVIGFIDMMSVISGVIEQGGSRRGANLGMLEVWHPDVWEFMSYKNDHEWENLREFITVNDEEKWSYFKKSNAYKLQMYNISIGITDDFLKALKEDSTWPFMWNGVEWELYKVEYRRDNNLLKSFEVVADKESTAQWKVRRIVPYPKSLDIFEVVSKRKVKASEVWNKLCKNAWANGCPGIINISEARRMHNGEYFSSIESTNPCGEQPLPAFGSCNLGSLILPSFLDREKGKIDYDLLKKAVHYSVRFLDDVTDCCEFPMPEAKKVSQKERRIGLGTTGIHDLLIGLKLAYDSQEGRNITEQLLTFIRDEAYKASIDLAKEKESFPAFKAEKYLESPYIKRLPENLQKAIKENGIRNVCILSQAPVGSTGTMMSVSQGCEPWFSMTFERHTGFGSYIDGCQDYMEWSKNHPNEKKPDYFKTATEIAPEDHIRMMVLYSKYIDSAVSKTVNLPNNSTVEDVSKIFLMALENGVKGVTIFRDGCRIGVLKNLDKKNDGIPAIVKKPEIVSDDPVIVDNGKKIRGNRAPGATTRIHLDSHNMYVTVNRNTKNEIVEVFAIIGESKKPNTRHTSGVEDSWAEGLGKMISLALRAGVSTESIIRNLKNIPSDKPVWAIIGESPVVELISSPPHAIARVIEEELNYNHPMSVKKEVDLSKKGGVCEDCGSTNIQWNSSFCYTCLDCTHIGCGNL